MADLGRVDLEVLSSSYHDMDSDVSTPLMTAKSGAKSKGGDNFEDTTYSNGMTVNEVSRMRSGTFSRTAKGSTLKRADAAWYMFDNLSCDQAEDLLRQHGTDCTYLVAHFHDPQSYGISIRLSEGDGVVYKHYAIGISGNEFHTEGIPGEFPTIEAVIEAVGLKMGKTLVPIFHDFNDDTNEFSITTASEEPPSYSQAEKFPHAARKPLPLIVPIYPTLRRMMRSQQQAYDVEAQNQPSPSTPLSPSPGPPDTSNRSCCWKAFHTDINGQWYKPHKAGPISGFLLIVGWIIFLLLFGWIVALALLLVLILVMFTYCFNFLCTGRCEIVEAEESTTVENVEGQGAAASRPPNQSGYSGTPQTAQ